MKCLIIAAGMGSRLFGERCPKPLVKLHGVPLIERVMRTVSSVSPMEFVVVLGYQADHVAAVLDEIAERNAFTIDTVFNTEWQRPNGLSVLAAGDRVDEPFLLMMADHLFTPALIRRVLEFPIAPGELALAVDRRVDDNPNVDLDDVTRVLSKDGRIEDIGKGIEKFNAFDTGVFFATTALFDALAASIEQGDETLSGGVRRLAAAGKALTIDIADEPWVDVDDPTMLAKAETLFDR